MPPAQPHAAIRPDGPPDEWRPIQAGIPLYPALFGRYAITAGWQATMLDRGESLEAAITRLGQMQSDRTLDWSDEQPGRIPFQVRAGPVARLGITPDAAYYADFATFRPHAAPELILARITGAPAGPCGRAALRSISQSTGPCRPLPASSDAIMSS